VLNSFVALARKKSDLLEPSLLKLSEIMRYMTYESEENVLLDDELNYLENYVDLQRLRFGNHVDIVINFDKSHVSGKEIAPMLLIPLLENAFKHGTATIQTPRIEANFSCLNDKTIVFEVKNKVSIQKCMRKDENHGIGLQNLKKRLHLLYPTRYEFKTQQQQEVFSAFLKIEL
jgi:LytS/YehU family sensor histidine kinase